MLLESEDGIWTQADARVFQILMVPNRTERRLLAAGRTIESARGRVASLRRRRAAAEAREHAQAERELAKELCGSGAWGRTFRIKARPKPASGGSGPRKRHPPVGSVGRALRAYRAPLVDDRGRVALFMRIRYVGFKSKNWRAGLPADHIFYILRENPSSAAKTKSRCRPCRCPTWAKA